MVARALLTYTSVFPKKVTPMVWWRSRKKQPSPPQPVGYGDKLFSELIDKVGFVAADDDRTCAKARAIDGQVFTAGEEPALPLEGCDGECRCLYVAVIDDEP